MVVLLFVSAFAETISIGAILPFLAVLTNPASLGGIPLLGPWATTLRPGAQLIAITAIAFIALAMISGLMRLALARSSQALAFNVSFDLANTAFAKVLRQEYSYYVGLHSADLITRFEKLHHLTFSVLISAIQAVVATFLGVMIIILLLLVSPVVALVAGGVLVGLYVVMSAIARPRLVSAGEDVTYHWTRKMKVLQEGLGGIRDTLLDRSQPAYERSFRHSGDIMRRSFITSAFLSQAPRILIETIGIVAIGAYVWTLAGRPGGIAAALPTLGALALGAQRLLPQLQIAYNGWTAVIGNAPGLAEIAELLVLEDRLPPLPSGEIACFTDQVLFDNVSFAYPDGTAVLRDVNFTIRHGERIGIAGPTGSGKSTLMDLLLGLLDPSDGRILFDGQPMTGPHRASWQAQVAHVPQSIYLTDDSLASNIAFGISEEDRDMDCVREAARQAGIADFIDGLPDGYDTQAGERGVRLSGGQRQRIGIARALYRRPRILVLDEATSALDNATESAVMASIEALGDDITVVMIAHRLTTLEKCGRILLVDKGLVSEASATVSHESGRSSR
ncbi:ABC transporter ATP-binding protein [Sphingomonas sp. HDW15A]|uniref:ABC transporter ATP-binding protein n=1 Tax=Sphingomonas sp. HDW15A TaxID=2714942 RepID=UPI0014080CE4|nr:ABC transporter ATP-binding protein [Sphingomonas sp. HDW15A]QIK95836.1 ABC transporter ATP-binding protein [Sphingomonas sp. HDW15A]